MLYQILDGWNNLPEEECKGYSPWWWYFGEVCDMVTKEDNQNMRYLYMLKLWEYIMRVYKII